jgi:hypothetical protein
MFVDGFATHQRDHSERVGADAEQFGGLADPKVRHAADSSPRIFEE